MNTVKVSEIFKSVTIKGYEHLYEVSNYGRVRSVRYNKVLKNSETGDYLSVTLCNDKKRKTIQIQRLVAGAHIGEESKKGIRVVHHINHNCKDNRVDNLKMVSHRTNCALRKEDNGLPTGVERRGNRYKAGIVIEGKKKYLGSFETALEAGNAYKNALKMHLNSKI